MLIELQEPFKSKWLKGYLIANNENRKMVNLVGESCRTTITYARYLMSVHLGYEVPDGLEVDHEDDDKANDSIDNLQLLTKQENICKENYRYIMEQQDCFGFHCAVCETPFVLTKRQLNMRIKQSKSDLAFCSTVCARTSQFASGNAISKSLPEELISRIKQLKQDGYSSYKISELTGVARNTVMKYW